MRFGVGGWRLVVSSGVLRLGAPMHRGMAFAPEGDHINTVSTRPPSPIKGLAIRVQGLGFGLNAQRLGFQG